MSDTDLVDSTSQQRAIAATVVPDVGELHVDHVTERVLGVVGDADPGAVAVDRHPLVLRRVPQLLRVLHRPGL